MVPEGVSAAGDAPERLDRLLDFLVAVDAFKTIERRAYIADGSRRETDAEHTWHMALCALLLHREIGFEADLGHTLGLILVHDLVEIHAGDTYAYDAVAATDQADREDASARRLFAILPPDLTARVDAMWREFEAGVTLEARLAKACDRLQGFLQNVIADGKTWKENGIARERTFIRTDLPRATDPFLRDLVDAIYKRADDAGMWGA